jgi:hypothetical protein
LLGLVLWPADPLPTAVKVVREAGLGRWWGANHGLVTAAGHAPWVRGTTSWRSTRVRWRGVQPRLHVLLMVSGVGAYCLSGVGGCGRGPVRP